MKGHGYKKSVDSKAAGLMASGIPQRKAVAMNGLGPIRNEGVGKAGPKAPRGGTGRKSGRI